MTVLTFDTLKYVKTLKAAGFEEPWAEALADVQRDILSANLEELATKRDIKELELSTKRDIKALELSTKQDIKALEQSTKQDIKALELSTTRDIKELELKMVAEIAPLKWGITVCVAGIMTLLLKFFFLH